MIILSCFVIYGTSSGGEKMQKQDERKITPTPEVWKTANGYKKKYYSAVFISYEETVSLWNSYEENGNKYFRFIFSRGSNGGWRGTLIVNEYGQVVSSREAERIESIIINYKDYFATLTPSLELQPLCVKLKQYLVELIIMLQQEEKENQFITEVLKCTLNIMVEFDKFIEFLEARSALTCKLNEPIDAESYDVAKELLQYHTHYLFEMEKLYISARKEIQRCKKELTKMNLKNEREILSCISKFNSGITYTKWLYHMKKYRAEIRYHKVYEGISQREELAQHIMKVSQEQFNKEYKKKLRN